MKNEMQRQKETMSIFEGLKLDIYIDSVFDQSLKEEEDTMLELDVSDKMNQDAFVTYLLVKLNYKITIENQSDVCIAEKALVSLKDKFLNMLQNMDTGEVRTENIGILLYVSSRLFIVTDGRKIYLISNLRSSLFSMQSTWDNYFAVRINRNFSEENGTIIKSGIQKAFGLFKAPLNLFGIGKQKARGADKDHSESEKSRRDFYPTIFTEIAQHLAMLNVPSDEATLVLIELCKKYEVGSNLMQSVFIVHQKKISVQYEERINQTISRRILSEDTANNSNSKSRLAFVLYLSFPYLSLADILNAGKLNRTCRRETSSRGLFSILRYCSPNQYQRTSIYKILAINSTMRV